MKNREKQMDLDRKYLNKLEDVTFVPIFILGIQRSGTSILYKLLSLTNCFNIVTAYHIIKYNELLHNHINGLEEKSKDELNKYFKNEAQHDRGIDRLQINADFPEEYGFVISQKNNQPKLDSENLKTFIEFCKKIQFISRNNKPILLKNPFDFANFIYIKSVLPNAKFIFIHRNPFKTLNSQLKAMRTLLNQKSKYMALLSPAYDKVFDNKILLSYYRFIYSSILPIRVNNAIKNLAETTDYFLENNGLLPERECISSKYEDLCEKPELEIEKILTFLNMRSEKHVVYSDFVKTRKTTELKEIQRKKKFIVKKMNKYIKYCGYNTADIE